MWRKKTCRILLSWILAISVIPFSGITALAENTEQNETPEKSGESAFTEAEFDRLLPEEPEGMSVSSGEDFFGELPSGSGEDTAVDEYDVWIESTAGKMVVIPGEEITLEAKARHCHAGDGSVTYDLPLYKWEILDGNEDGYIAFKDGIEGVTGEFPTATLTFAGVPDMQLCDMDERNFEYFPRIRVTVYEGTDDAGNPIERASGELSGIALKDEYFEIDPLKIDPIPVEEARTFPLSIRYYSYYFREEGFRCGLDPSWTFHFDENVLEVTDAFGNRIDGSGQIPFVPAENETEPLITVRRLTGEETHFRADVSFSYIDHNGTLHGPSGSMPEETFGMDQYLESAEDPGSSQGSGQGDPSDPSQGGGQGDPGSAGSLWFDIPDGRIYSDGTYTFDLHTEGIERDCTFDLEVGHYDDQGLVEAYTPGTEYNFDAGTGTLTLYGDRLSERGFHFFGFHISALDAATGDLLCENGFMFEVLEPWTDYWRQEDKDLLPGWDHSIDRWCEVHVENAQNPNGINTRYEVTGLEVVGEAPAEAGKQVLSIYAENEGTDDARWHVKAENHGDAVVRVFYIDIEGDDQSYDFHVHINADVYDVNVYPLTGSNRALPGQTLLLGSDVWHHGQNGEEEDVTQGLTFVWDLARENSAPAPEEFAVLEPGADPWTASVTFRSLQEGEQDIWYALRAEVLVYKGSAVEENKVGSGSIRLEMAESYPELWPTWINPGLEVGQTWMTTAQFRLYPGSDGNEYDLAGDGQGRVQYYWYYDPNAVQVYDEDGIQVGNDNESGEYKGSAASSGASREFSIYRRRPWGTDLFLNACWTDTEGNEHWENRRFHLDERSYRAWLEIDDDRIFNTGTRSYPVRLEGFPDGAAYGTDYEIDLTVGLWGEDGIGEPFTEGIEYTFDGTELTLDGAQLAARGLQDDQPFGVTMMLKTGGESVWYEDWDLRLRIAGTEYEKEEDRELLPGWDGTVNGSYTARVRDSEHPDGMDAEYRVLNVEVISDKPWEGEDGPVLGDFHRDQNENDPDDYWWYYRAEHGGEAVLQVTYLDLEGAEQSYTFTLFVSRDVYQVRLSSEGSAFNAFPGAEIGLYADTYHEYLDEKGEYHRTSDGVTLTWFFEDGEEFAQILPDTDDPLKAVLKFNRLPAGQDWIDEHIRICVRTFDADGQERGGFDSRDFFVRSDYTEIWPLELDSGLDMGRQIENIDFEVRRYTLGQEGYEILDDRYDVRYEWHYDPNALAVIERADGGSVSVPDGSVTSGAGAITISRLREWGTGLSLRAVWTESSGQEHDVWTDHWFHEKNYDIWFMEENSTLRDDEEKTFSLNTENLGDLPCTIQYHIRYRNADNEYADLTEGREYTIDPSGSSVTVNGDLAERALRTGGNSRSDSPDEIQIEASLLYQGQTIREPALTFIQLQRTGKSIQNLTAADITMTMLDAPAAAVNGPDPESVLTFASSNEKIVIVDDKGRLTPVAAGTAQITVKAAATLSYRPGATTFNVTVNKLALTDKNVTIRTNAPAAGYTYNAKTQKPTTVTVTYKNTEGRTITLTSGTDYTLTWPAASTLINAGTKTITVKARGTKTSGTAKITFKINKAEQTALKCTVTPVRVGQSLTYTVTGSRSKKLTVTSSDKACAAVTSTNQATQKTTVKGIKVGTVKLNITSAADTNYNAKTITVALNVVPAATTKLTASNEATGIKLTWAKVTGAAGYYVYRGSTKIATINKNSTVNYLDKAANTNGTKYTHKIVAYATLNKKAAASTAGKTLATFRVARPAISSVTNSAANKMTVKWAKNAKANGYQLQYALTGSFTGAKTVNITNPATITRTIAGLTKGKTYYVRIRTFKTAGSTKTYSAWSPARTVKIK